MKDENRIVHTVWIGKRFSMLECLTVRLLQKHGHEVHLWAYEKIDNVPERVIIEDAALVMPKDTIFRYAGKPFNGIPNDGIGSFSHWSDQFQMKLLYKYGGTYLQLDVSCLKPLDFEQPYVFFPIGEQGIQTCLMKLPQGSAFAEECDKALHKEINRDTIASLDWFCSLRLITHVLRKHKLYKTEFILPEKNILDLGGNIKSGPFYENVIIPEDVCIIHWSNATNFENKDYPLPGSVYECLLKEAGIIKRFNYIKRLFVFYPKRLIKLLNIRNIPHLVIKIIHSWKKVGFEITVRRIINYIRYGKA